MFTLQNIQLFSFGTAAVIDTAVLAMLLERRNWRRVVLPIGMFVSGAWLYHAGTFAHSLVYVGGAWSEMPRLVAMTMMGAGLLIMPAAMHHGMLRYRKDGFGEGGAPDWRRALGYLPILGLVGVWWRLSTNPMGSFLELVQPFLPAYMVWLGVVSVSVAWQLNQVRRRQTGEPWAGRLCGVATVVVLLSFGLHVTLPLLARQVWPQHEGALIIPLVFAPLLIVLTLAWAVARYHVMRLVLPRAAIYGVIVVGVILFDHTLLADHRTALSERFGVDFGLIEGILLLGLMLAWSPARQRMSEALRYLLGERASLLRQRARRMAVQLSGLSGGAPADMVRWFVQETTAALEATWCGTWLWDEHDDLLVAEPEHGRLDLESVRKIHDVLAESDRTHCRPEDAWSPDFEDLLRHADAALAVRITHPGIRGITVLGRRLRLRDVNDEQASTFVMLVEHLGVALNNSRLQADRLAAERRAQQNQKLSMLGLVASSIAHEVKNPLSSIKTIVTVLEEEAQPEIAEDLSVIRSEVDRLSETVTGLLRFARPATTSDPASAEDAIRSTLRLMAHLAKKHGVSLQSTVAPDLPRVASDDALREILFNLIGNGIEAAGEAGSVVFCCERENGALVISVEDSGPGIPPEIQDHIFEPFVTSKPDGTGLGLYVVGQRTKELGGTIECDTAHDGGTRFRLVLPLTIDHDRTSS